MGYEVIYSYHEKIDGNYNKEEIKTIKKKVGDPFEDVSLERLATSVMGQLARRDVFVVGVEIFELSKKTVSFRETDNGVVIKNKKFTFDQAVGFTVQEVCENKSECSNESTNIVNENKVIHPHEQLAIQKQSSARTKKPIDTVVYSPELPMIHEVAKRGYKLTIDKKYYVYAKTSSLQGDIYTIIDDSNKEIKIGEKYFIAPTSGLIGDNELNFSETQKDRDGGKLFWGNANSDNVPIIRR